MNDLYTVPWLCALYARQRQLEAIIIRTWARVARRRVAEFFDTCEANR